MKKKLVLEVQGLAKCYGSFRAVDGISFSVPRGSVVGLLGQNGAGKTTTIQMLLGITRANGGTIRYFDMDFFKHRQECLQRINFASSFNTLQGRISVGENLLVFADLYRVKDAKKRIQELSALLEITDLLPMKYWDLSKGQQTRANIVKALLNDPELILFDEPTASLDPDIADKLLSLIEKLRAERQMSILYTSHDMGEVARICDEVIFLDHGKVVAHDTPKNLTKNINWGEITIEFEGKRDAVERVMKKFANTCSFPTPTSVSAKVTQEKIPTVIFDLSEAGIWLKDISINKPTLEHVFMNIARGTYGISSKN